MSTRELQLLESDLDSAHNRVAALQKENERLRTLNNESQNEYRKQLEHLSTQKMAVENELLQVRMNYDLEQSKRIQAQRELSEALADQRRHAELVSNVRKQVSGKLDVLMEELHRKDSLVHELEYKLRERERDSARVAFLEKVVHNREENITTLSEELGKVRMEYNELVAAQHSAHVQRAAGNVEGGESGVDDFLLQAIVPQFKQWLAETEKDMYGFEDFIETMFDELSDFRMVLERGVMEAASMLASMQDRSRLRSLRRLEQQRAEQLESDFDFGQSPGREGSPSGQKLHLSKEMSFIRRGCQNTRFVSSRIKNSTAEMRNFFVQLKQYVTQFCSSGGLETAVPRSRPSRSIAATPAPTTRQQDYFSPSVSVPPPPPMESEPRGESSQAVTDTLQQANARLEEAHQQAHEFQAQNLQVKMQLDRVTLELEQVRREREDWQQRCNDAEQKVRAAHEAANKIREEQQSEREKSFKQSLEEQRKHSEYIKSMQLEYDEHMRQLKSKLDEEERQGRDIRETLRRSNEDATETIQKLTLQLEDQKSRRKSLKIQKEELQRQVQESKGIIAQCSQRSATSGSIN